MVVPCLLWSLVIVPSWPVFMGNEGWVRSKAWTEVFSSMHSTTAFSGGFM